jgi:hypothetical protein
LSSSFAIRTAEIITQIKNHMELKTIMDNRANNGVPIMNKIVFVSVVKLVDAR